MKVVLYTFIFLLCISCDKAKQVPTANDILSICATTTDIESIVQAISGTETNNVVTTEIFTCCKGEEDPHYVHVTPSFTKFLSQADLLIHLGFGCESGWLPDLLNTVHRPELNIGQNQNLDLTKNVRLLKDTEGIGEKGNVHEEGNPHYLLDPIEGIKAAKLICDKLSELRPKHKELFQKNYQIFRQKIATMLVGKKLAQKYNIENLASLFEQDKLENFLEKKGDKKALKGHFALIAPYRNKKIIADHDLWPYFARQYGVTIAGYLEPSPGIPPTTKHLQKLIEKIKKEKIKIVLCNPSFNIRHAQFVAKNSIANVVKMAHQTKSKPNTNDYISMLEFNFQMLYNALRNNNE